VIKGENEQCFTIFSAGAWLRGLGANVPLYYEMFCPGMDLRGRSERVYRFETDSEFTYLGNISDFGASQDIRYSFDVLLSERLAKVSEFQPVLKQSEFYTAGHIVLGIIAMASA
jgi:hypothetical protein